VRDGVSIRNKENYKMEKQLLEFLYSGPYTIQSTGFSYSKTISSAKEVSITNTINLDDPKIKYYPDSFSRETSDCYLQENGT